MYKFMETNHMLPSHLFCALTATSYVRGLFESSMCNVQCVCIHIDGEILSTWNMGFDALHDGLVV